MRLAFVVVLVIALPTVADRTIDLERDELVGSLSRLLDDYVAAGFPIVYSTELIGRLRIERSPERGEPLDRLRRILREVGLEIEATGARLLIVSSDAQPVHEFVGRVVDASTGRPLEGVRVELEGRSAVTGADGSFRLRTGRTAELQVSADGFDSTTVAVQEGTAVSVALAPSPRPLEEIVVVSSRYALQTEESTQRRRFDSHQLNDIPTLANDPIRAVGLLPGTAGVGVSARPFIRGGLQDETLMLFDSIELLEPFHLKDFQSVFSGVDPSLVQSIDVYTGGFPVRYGGRMSGVIDMNPAPIAPTFRAAAGLSFLSAAASASGPLAQNRGSWRLAARRGNLDFVTARVNPQIGEPRYSDGHGRITWQLSPRAEVQGGFLVYDDDIMFSTLDDGQGEFARSTVSNSYVWSRLDQALSDRVHAVSTLSFTHVDHDRWGFQNDPDADDGIGDVDDRRRFDVATFDIRVRADASADAAVEGGVQLQYSSGEYSYRSVVERGALAAMLGVPRSVHLALKESPHGLSASAYGLVKRRFDAFVLEAGVRWDAQRYASKSQDQISPRLSVKWDVRPNTRVRASLGRFFQADGIHELQVRDGVSAFQPAQNTDHYILGIEGEVGSRWNYLVEAWLKHSNAPRKRFENLFNPFVLLPEIAADRIMLDALRSSATGFEATLRYEGDEVAWWASYARLRAADRVVRDEVARWEPRTWSQDHTINVGVLWDREPWSASAVASWHSGWRTTDFTPDPALNRRETARNGRTLAPFFSLDLRINRSWRWDRQELDVFFEINNATSRENIGALEYSLEWVEGAYEADVEAETLIPIVPSIGFMWRFG